MNEQNTYNTQRRASTAIMLSLIWCGFGQVYCGRLIRGLFFAFLGTLPVQMMLALPVFKSQGQLSSSCISLLLLAEAVSIASAIDAWFLVRKTHPDYVLKEYNRWQFYLLWCLCGLGWSMGLAAMARQNIMEAFKVPKISHAMEPQVIPGSRILIDKRIYQQSDPSAGDVVVFLNPDNRRLNYVRRVVAVAGDTVAVKGGFAWVNGKKLAGDGVVDLPSDLNHPAQPREVIERIGSKAFTIITGGEPKVAPEDFPETIVPKNHVFVLSDNRDKAADSRKFGPIPIVGIEGRVIFTYGWSRIGTIE